MEKTVIKRFSEEYTHGNHRNKYEYFVTIVKDTENYKYRILNLTSGTIWRGEYFNSYDDALTFLNNHPHYVKGLDMEINLNRSIPVDIEMGH